MMSTSRLAALVICFLALSRVNIFSTPQRDIRNQEPPPREREARLAGCNLGGSIARIPSKEAGPQGLAVRISPPQNPRYPEGAPIAVQVTVRPARDQVRACLGESGFVEIGFACPGSNANPVGGWEESGGKPGPEACMDTLADVLAFATGRTTSLEKKSIGDYAGSMKVLTNNVGVIGWSAGGNLTTLAMARHGDRFGNLAWYASWESPVLGTSDVGAGSIYQSNRFYDYKTGRVDFSRLRYGPDMPLWVWPAQGLQFDPSWPHGGLYLDGDGDGIFNRDQDYGFWLRYRSLDAGQPRKAFYPEVVTREASDRKLFGEKWPAHIATLEEVERLANVEDVMRRIALVIKRLPQLAVMVFESERGHVSNSVDHPHAIAQVNAWLAAGARWVRFNPDLLYVEDAMGKPLSRRVQNPAGRNLDRANIADLVEPEPDDGGPTDGKGMVEASREHADREHSKTWTAVLDRLLVR